MVKERTVADEIKDEALETTLLNVRSMKRKLQGEEVETASDHKYIQEALDKAMITSDNAPRHAKSGDVNVQTNTQVNNNHLSVEYVD